MVKTFAFLDLETTGLPMHESNLTRITELCIVACSVEHFYKNEMRVLHKLSLCFNPHRNISKISSEITGLTDDLLQNDNHFNENTCDLLVQFLSQLQQPVCLIAHNGTKFDYPILKAHLENLNKCLSDTIVCCDSLNIFRKTNKQWKKFSLRSIHNRLFGHDPPNAHNAEADVIALMNCVFGDPKFIDVVLSPDKDNIYTFNSVTPIIKKYTNVGLGVSS